MKTIGILGGMGPMATVDLLQKIIRFTDADSDRDHIHVITDSYCKIPDRTAFILGKGENPLEYLINSAKKLQNIGVDFIIMPCNTAHYFYNDIKKNLDLPFINMILETAKVIGKGSTVGLMATSGTYSGRVYENIFTTYGINIFSPSDDIKNKINKVIYDYKSGCDTPREQLKKIIDCFKEVGIKKIILGCTELPIIFKEYNDSIEFIDPTEILSKAAIKYAGKNIKILN